MSRFAGHGRTLALVGVLVPLIGLFVYTAMRSGPLAPIPVVVAPAASQALTPALFGTGNVAARYTYKVGPTAPGRLLRINPDVGEKVRAGQVLGEMAPIDLSERITAQGAGIRRTEAAAHVAEAQLREAGARKRHIEAELQRYEELWTAGGLSAEGIAAKRQERQLVAASYAAALASVGAARQETARFRADQAGLLQQRANLLLISPANGLVATREAEPGTTVVAGQPVLSLIDPAHLWLHVRFDQARSSMLHAGLPVSIVLRSREQALSGRIALIEPVADAVTEETLAKVIFTGNPQPRPAVGELAEVTVTLGVLPATLVVSNAAIHRVQGNLGVWVLEAGGLHFAPVKLGVSDLAGHVQILEGLRAGEQVVTHSLRALSARSRVEVVKRLPGVAP